MISDLQAPLLQADAAVFNRSTFDELVRLLTDGRMRPHLSTLRRLLEGAVANDASPEEVRKLAHQLVSQAGTLGFEQICFCSREVENAPRRGGLALQVGALHLAMRAAAPTLDRLLAEAA